MPDEKKRIDRTSGGRQLGGTTFGQTPGEGQPDDPERKSQRILKNDEQERFDRNPRPHDGSRSD